MNWPAITLWALGMLALNAALFRWLAWWGRR
jgi:hypothetical protein